MSLAEVRTLPTAATGKGDTGSTSPAVSPTNPVKRQAPRVRLNPIQSEEERRQVGEIMQLFSEARDARRPMVQKWDRCYRMLYNQFWDSQSRGWRPAPQIPEIFPIVDALAAWEGDQQPRFTVSPEALPNSDFSNFFQTLSQNLEAVIDSSYQANSEEVEWAKANWDKYRFGTGIVKTIWDQTLAGGLGDAITRHVPIHSFYPDPNATNLADATYMIEVKRMSLDDLDRRYPGTYKLLEDGLTVTTSIDQTPTQLNPGGQSGVDAPRGNPGAVSPSTAPRYGKVGGGRLHATDLPGITVIECWVREHEHYEATNINAREKETRTFDNWHLYVVAGNRLIMDEPCDNLWSHGGHPYDRLVQRDEGEFWGHALVELLLSPQVFYNRALASLQWNIELTGNPMFKDVGQTGRTAITNKPGTRVPMNQAALQGGGWMDPPRVSPEMTNILQWYLQRMEAVSGLSAVMRGGSPGGRQAQGTVDALQEAGFIRIRSSLRFMEHAMRNAGTKKADLIIENYTTPRLVSIAGPGGYKTSLALKGRHFLIPTSDGATPLRYQLLVDVGSRQHTSRQMREAQEVQLYTMGVTDRDALLSSLNYPNWQAVAKRVNEREMQLAQMGETQGPGKRAQAGH